MHRLTQVNRSAKKAPDVSKSGLRLIDTKYNSKDSRPAEERTRLSAVRWFDWDLHGGDEAHRGR